MHSIMPQIKLQCASKKTFRKFNYYVNGLTAELTKNKNVKVLSNYVVKFAECFSPFIDNYRKYM